MICKRKPTKMKTQYEVNCDNCGRIMEIYGDALKEDLNPNPFERPERICDDCRAQKKVEECFNEIKKK